MQNQYRNIIGERDISADELQLMNDIKAAGETLRVLLGRVEGHIEDQHQHAKATEDHNEMMRLDQAKPFRWLEDAERALASGVMFAARAVAQPSTF